MAVSIQEVINSIKDSGVAESPAAQAIFTRALLEVYGEEFSSEKVFQYLMEHGSWSAEAQSCIQAVLQSFEGQMVAHSERDLVPGRITNLILNDTERWGLTDDQKLEIASDRSLFRRWANEYSEKDGFQHLLDYVVDDEIFEWKQAHPAKPSLDQMISSANQRMDNRGNDTYICLTAGKDRTWTASAVGLEIMELTGARALIDDKNKRIVITGPDAGSLFSKWSTELGNHLYASGRRDRMDYPMSPAIGDYDAAIPLVKEQSYPVQLYYERTDINGSGVTECESCSSREELLSLLNWIGKAGFVPIEFWSYDIEKTKDPLIMDMIQAGQQRRYEVAQKEMAALMMDNFEPEPAPDVSVSKKAKEMER